MGLGSDIAAVAKNMEELSNKANQSKGAYDQFVATVNSGAQVLNGSVEALTKLAGAAGVIPGGTAAAVDSVKILNDTFGKITDIAGGVLSAYKSIVTGIDGFSSGQRKLTAELFESQAAFGTSIDSVDSFRASFRQMQDQFATADYGFLSSEQISSAVGGLAKVGIGFREASQEVSGFGRQMNLISAVTLQAGALGLETSKYYGLLADAIKEQGLNANQAVSQMAMFGATAQDTGLDISSVADTLNTAAGTMAKFGATAALGRPIIEGFAKSLTQTGLGIKNATSLTSTLIGSFKQLTESYSLAYVTMQRGGLDFGGGGGALGAGIGLRAKLLEAEKSPEKQADIGKELAKGMRDTLASFTGGEIVTVSEAAKSPELQTQYYAQTQLLESMYGIRGAEADRTLELMKNLGSVLNSGNDNLSATMEKQLSEFVDMQNKTKDVGEILDVKFSAFLAQQEEHYQGYLERSHDLATGLLDVFDATTTEGFSKGMEEIGKKVAEITTDLFGKEAGDNILKKEKAAGKVAGEVGDMAGEALTTTAEGLVKALSAASDALTLIVTNLKTFRDWTTSPGTLSSPSTK